MQHQAKLDQRKLLFKQRLLDLTRQHHTTFLQKLSETERQIDYDFIRCWNSKFEVHKVPSVSEAKLPPKPNSDRPQPLEDFLKNSQNLKNKIVQEIMESTALKFSKVEEKLPVIPLESKHEKLGISQKLLDLVIIIIIIDHKSTK